MRTTLNEAGLAVDVMGEGGEPLLFVHGMGESGARAWPAQRALARAYRLSFVQLFGYGMSPDRGSQDFAVDAVSVVASLAARKQHLIGHSYGGVVALLAALDKPDRVLSLTLIEPAHGAVSRNSRKLMIKGRGHTPQNAGSRFNVTLIDFIRRTQGG